MNKPTSSLSKRPAEGATDLPSHGTLKYQSMLLPGGVTTEGHDRSYLDSIIFGGQDTPGTILDIGSCIGYFCIEAEKRGWKATGIESDAESLTQSREIARLNNVSPTFICGDFETHEFGASQFDTVICLNVLHHLHDAVASIRKMMALSRDRIVLEFSRPGFRDLVSRSLNPLAVLANTMPIIYLGDPRAGYDVLSRSFLFTPRALKVLFNTHTNLYEPVLFRRSPFKGRMTMEARRRNIDHVVVVVGPTSSGKSTLIAELSRNASRRALFGLPDQIWHAVPGHPIDLPSGHVPGALVHYDLLRPYRRSIRTFDRDPRLDLLKVAKKLTIITLVPPPDTLRARFAKNERSWLQSKSKRRHTHLAERYKDPTFLEHWYAEWFSYLQPFQPKIGCNLILISDGQSERIIDAKNWRAEYRNLFESSALSL